MTLSIDADQLRRLHEHAAEGYPHEVVGILAGDKDSHTVTTVAALINERADSAHNRYKVSGLTLMRAEQRLEAEGHAILGYYHSHPDHPAKYSEYDRDHALPNMAYPIVSVMQGKPGDVLAWRLTDDRSSMDPQPIEIEAPADDGGAKE